MDIDDPKFDRMVVKNRLKELRYLRDNHSRSMSEQELADLCSRIRELVEAGRESRRDLAAGDGEEFAPRRKKRSFFAGFEEKEEPSELPGGHAAEKTPQPPVFSVLRGEGKRRPGRPKKARLRLVEGGKK